VLLLDIGNSAGKWLLVSSPEECRRGRGTLDQLPDQLVEDVGEALSEATVLIASVAAPAQEQALAARLRDLGCRVWFARSRGELNGLINAYADPERMGVDRWLAMVAARRRCSGEFCVVDAGSALTIDLVAANGQHEGGYIIPGSALMERALFADTQRVRYDAAAAPALDPGRSTAEAVSHGALLAQAGAVSLALAAVRERGLNPQLFLCGGGAELLQSVLKDESVHAPDLVFEGLLRQAELECGELLDFSTVARALSESNTVAAGPIGEKN
jgi:type III pantothenate kinase